mgnify:CR=1 FL=1
MALPCCCHAQPQAGWQAVHTLARCGASLVGQLQSQQLMPCHLSPLHRSSQLQQPQQLCTGAAADSQLQAVVHCQQHLSVPAHAGTQHPREQQQQIQYIHQLSQRPPLLQHLQHRPFSHLQGRVHCSVRSRTGISTHCSRQGGLLLQAGTSLHEAWGSSSSSSNSSSRCLSSSARAWRPGGAQVSASSAGAAQVLEELSRLREGGEAQVGGTGGCIDKEYTESMHRIRPAR